MNFMQGRNGPDDLGRMLAAVSMTLIVLDLFVRSSFLSLLGLAVLGYAYYRMFSRDIARRRMENEKYLRLKNRVIRGRSRDRKNYRYYTCSQCKKTVRVPRGKGKILITCPNCKNEFIRKT